MNWYTRITQNLGVIPDFITHYEAELISAKQEVKIYGNVEKNIAAIPGVTEHRFNQLQEIEAVLNYLNIQLRRIRRKHFQKYLVRYFYLIAENVNYKNKFIIFLIFTKRNSKV